MVGGRRDMGLYGGRNIQGASVWLVVGKTEDSVMDAMCKEPGCGWRFYGGRNVSGAWMWLEVGETEDCMMDAMYQESACGWR